MKEQLVQLEARFLDIAKKCDEQGTYPAIRVEQGEYVVTKKEHAIGTHSVNQCVIIYISKGEYHGLCHIDGHAEIHSLAQFFERFSRATSDIAEKIEVKIYGAKKKAISSGLNDPRLSLHKLQSFLEQECIKKSLQEQNIDQLIKNRDQLSEGNTPSHFTIKVGEEISDKIPSDEIAIYRALHWIQDINRREGYLGTYPLIEGYSSKDLTGTCIYLDERTILILQLYIHNLNRYDEEIQALYGQNYVVSLPYNHEEHTPAVKVILSYWTMAVQNLLGCLNLAHSPLQEEIKNILQKMPLYIGEGVETMNQEIVHIVQSNFNNIKQLKMDLQLWASRKGGATIGDALTVASKYAYNFGFDLNCYQILNGLRSDYHREYGADISAELIRLKKYGAEISVKMFVSNLVQHHNVFNALIIINSRFVSGYISLFDNKQCTIEEVLSALNYIGQLGNANAILLKLNEHIDSTNREVERFLERLTIDEIEFIEQITDYPEAIFTEFTEVFNGILDPLYASGEQRKQYRCAHSSLITLRDFVMELPQGLKMLIGLELKSSIRSKIEAKRIELSDRYSKITDLIDEILKALDIEFPNFCELSISFDIASQVQPLTGMGFEVAQKEYWYEYNQFGLDKLLLLRLEQLNTYNNLQIIKSGFILYNSTESISMLALNILQIASSKTTLLPLNIEQKHWAGLVIQQENKTIKISYLDSLHPSQVLVEELVMVLRRSCLDYKVDFDAIVVEDQRYNNCGPELIENFVFYLTGDRFSQEDALYMHSYLYEQSLLMQKDGSLQAAAEINSKLPILYLGHKWLENKALDAIVFYSMEILEFAIKTIETLVNIVFPEQQSDWNIAQTLFYMDLLNSALNAGGMVMSFSNPPTPNDDPSDIDGYGLPSDQDPELFLTIEGNMTSFNMTDEVSVMM